MINFKENYDYLCYIFMNKRLEFFSFLLFIFGLVLIPYFYTCFNILFYHPDKIDKYFGDGSIIMIACSIACNSLNSILIIKNDEEKVFNQFVLLLLVLLYAGSSILFFNCQVKDRSRTVVISVAILSFLYLILAFGFAFYDKYIRFIKYDEETQILYQKWKNKIEKKMSKKSSENEIKV